MRSTKIHAWDHTWSMTQHLHGAGSYSTPEQEEVREIMGAFYQMWLPVKGIHKLADLMLAVEKLVKKREREEEEI